MDAFKTAFEKLKQLKQGADDYVGDYENKLVKLHTSLGIPEEQAQQIVQNAQSGAMMAGSIGNVAKPTKIFRDPSIPKSLSAEQRKQALERMMGSIDKAKLDSFKKSGLIK